MLSCRPFLQDPKRTGNIRVRHIGLALVSQPHLQTRTPAQNLSPRFWLRHLGFSTNNLCVQIFVRFLLASSNAARRLSEHIVRILRCLALDKGGDSQGCPRASSNRSPAIFVPFETTRRYLHLALVDSWSAQCAHVEGDAKKTQLVLPLTNAKLANQRRHVGPKNKADGYPVPKAVPRSGRAIHPEPI